MKDIKDINILVVGDIMLDKYIIGAVDRISPEAPVPIVHVNDEYSTLGGCGNVVRNIRELGSKVSCLSSVGLDENGDTIIKLLQDIDVFSMVAYESKKTISKERIVTSERKIQMLRVDREIEEEIDANELISIIDEDKNDYDMIVISDYGKGVITRKLMKYLNSRKEKIIIDPKPKNKKYYGDSFLITPNEKEAKEMGGYKELIFNGALYVLETKGKKGMTLYDNADHWDIHADEVEVYNVSGAGDTVISVMAVCLSMGWNHLYSSHIANKCASYVVTKPGTSIVPQDKFFSYINKHIF